MSNSYEAPAQARAFTHPSRPLLRENRGLQSQPNRDSSADISLNQRLAFVTESLMRAGPAAADYPALDAWLLEVHRDVKQGTLTQEGLSQLRNCFGEALSPETLQGFAFCKPYGYAGDFHIIDLIYREHISHRDSLANWDRYFHRHAAPRAVRNRKIYFHHLLDSLSEQVQLHVLNVGCGPGRCVYDWLQRNPRKNARFHCIDIDSRAIQYAQELTAGFMRHVSFEHANAMRYCSHTAYDLVWVAGICDYLDDDAFRHLLHKLIPAVAPGGELVLGNFSTNNPSRAYMEVLGDWWLHHRTAEQLLVLARQCGIDDESLRVQSEPEGVNLFLRISI